MSMRVPPHCFRLAPLAENVTAQRSVDYLTITNTFGVPSKLFWFYYT
ncbi:MAG: hypothetical protein LBQ66_07885 [Planctomycetaceae bacterium]|nr:hypothetical protein [Planctomycetaceae bacterium]